MAIAATALLDRLTRGRSEKLLRFGTVSVVGIVITQAIILVVHGVLDVDATVTNLIAVTVSAGPVFLLNKRWVWGLGGRARLRREVLPFWGFTLLGLALSTILVAVVDQQTDRTFPVMLANIAGFGIVWVAKFLFLDSVVFAALADDDDEDPAA